MILGGKVDQLGRDSVAPQRCKGRQTLAVNEPVVCICKEQRLFLPPTNTPLAPWMTRVGVFQLFTKWCGEKSVKVECQGAPLNSNSKKNSSSVVA